MSQRKVTARGQITLPKDVLYHLGIGPGDKIAIEKQRNGCITLRAVRLTGKIDDFFGLLADKTSKVATLDELKEAISDGWAAINR